MVGIPARRAFCGILIPVSNLGVICQGTSSLHLLPGVTTHCGPLSTLIMIFSLVMLLALALLGLSPVWQQQTIPAEPVAGIPLAGCSAFRLLALSLAHFQDF